MFYFGVVYSLVQKIKMIILSCYCFIQVPGASEASIRDLPPSAVSDPSNFDAMALLATKKGSPLEAIVDQVRDGSTIRVYLLPDFQHVQVFVAGIQVYINPYGQTFSTISVFIS